MNTKMIAAAMAASLNLASVAMADELQLPPPVDPVPRPQTEIEIVPIPLPHDPQIHFQGRHNDTTFQGEIHENGGNVRITIPNPLSE